MRQDAQFVWMAIIVAEESAARRAAPPRERRDHGIEHRQGERARAARKVRRDRGRGRGFR